MIRLLTQLDTLADNDPRMKNAVENIKKDCETEEQPYGNIKKKVLDSICCRCGSCGDDETDHLKEVFEEHRSINNPHWFNTVKPPQNQPVKRVMSLHSFIKYHMFAGVDSNSVGGGGYDSQSSIFKMEDELLERFGDIPAIVLELSELRGTTGRTTDPTWWTFEEPGTMPPQSGEDYMKELALGEGEFENAEASNIVLEISIGSEYENLHFFKPTALDAFTKESKFKPETTGKRYGYTNPEDNSLQSRPEIVSFSKSYADFKRIKHVNMKKYNFRDEK